jgi:hypothetical protein
MKRFKYKHGRIFWQEDFYVCESCGRSSQKQKHTYLVTCGFCGFCSRESEPDYVHPAENLVVGETGADYFLKCQRTRKAKWVR